MALVFSGPDAFNVTHPVSQLLKGFQIADHNHSLQLFDAVGWDWEQEGHAACKKSAPVIHRGSALQSPAQHRILLLLLPPFYDSLSGTTRVSWYQKINFWILLKQR